MAKHGEEVRDALVRQWQAITAAVATIDPETPSRVAGWRNREVVAHLRLQSALLRKFTATAPTQHAVAGSISRRPPARPGRPCGRRICPRPW